MQRTLSPIGHMEHHSIIKEVVFLTVGHTAYFILNI